jgi:hypothetical protein
MGPLRVLFVPNGPLLWTMLVVTSAILVGWIFALTDAAATMRRGAAWLRDRFR